MGQTLRVQFEIEVQELIREIAKEVVKQLAPARRDVSETNQEFFTVKTLAKYMQVSDQWVYERIQKNEIPFIKVGKFPRFRRVDIDAWLDSQKVPVVNPLSRTLKTIPKSISR